MNWIHGHPHVTHTHASPLFIYSHHFLSFLWVLFFPSSFLISFRTSNRRTLFFFLLFIGILGLQFSFMEFLVLTIFLSFLSSFHRLAVDRFLSLWIRSYMITCVYVFDHGFLLFFLFLFCVYHIWPWGSHVLASILNFFRIKFF
ncbi:hypothetical protein DFH27DRAFT_555359 [Peziza echinospora]|nr:hypothetical protein DFH27DRAFT_555359 [Peziza echinospora]